jgi:hypothetical protein
MESMFNALAARFSLGLARLILLCALLVCFVMLTTETAYAGCRWVWRCEPLEPCGFVPVCDLPDDVPPPLQGVRPVIPPDVRPTEPPQSSHDVPAPLPGTTPINPPPPGQRRIGPPTLVPPR